MQWCSAHPRFTTWACFVSDRSGPHIVGGVGRRRNSGARRGCGGQQCPRVPRGERRLYRRHRNHDGRHDLRVAVRARTVPPLVGPARARWPGCDLRRRRRHVLRVWRLVVAVRARRAGGWIAREGVAGGSRRGVSGRRLAVHPKATIAPPTIAPTRPRSRSRLRPFRPRPHTGREAAETSTPARESCGGTARLDLALDRRVATHTEQNDDAQQHQEKPETSIPSTMPHNPNPRHTETPSVARARRGRTRRFAVERFARLAGQVTLGLRLGAPAPSVASRHRHRLTVVRGIPRRRPGCATRGDSRSSRGPVSAIRNSRTIPAASPSIGNELFHDPSEREDTPGSLPED